NFMGRHPPQVSMPVWYRVHPCWWAPRVRTGDLGRGGAGAGRCPDHRLVAARALLECWTRSREPARARVDDAVEEVVTEPNQPALESLSTEERRFAPSPEFAAQANVKASAYESVGEDLPEYWAGRAREVLSWRTPFTQKLDWSEAPVAKWFADGTLNAAYNAVDRHVEAGLGDRVALLFEGEPGDSRAITYAELQDEVARTANVLTSLGVQTGDRVAIYLPMIPEAVVALLACARIGAPHSVVFG